MILFKPYGHLTKIGTDDFRLSLSVLIPDEYELVQGNRQDINGDKITRLTFNVISLPGKVHSAAKDLLLYIDDVPNKHVIEVVIQTHIPSHELPPDFQELISDLTKSPLLLGKTVLCTDGVEEGDDDREGSGEEKKSDPVDD